MRRKIRILVCSKKNRNPGFLTDPHGANLSHRNYDFQWDEANVSEGLYDVAWDLMLTSIREIVDYAKKVGVRIAFESEGSLHKKEAWALQQAVRCHFNA